MRAKVLLVLATAWDAKQLEACRAAWEGEVELVVDPLDEDACAWDADVVAEIDRVATRWGGEVAGVFTSSDYPGATVAAAVATRLGLPGSDPRAVLRTGHKFLARQALAEAVPEATPAFWLLDPTAPDELPEDLAFPCFVKPVKGAFSVLARRFDAPHQLREHLRSPAVARFMEVYAAMFDRLLAGLSDLRPGARHLIAEELLVGEQVTLEGWVQGGEVHLLGIVDSRLHPGTGSFARFDYPSSLPEAVQARMFEVARGSVGALGLQETLFNIELTWDPERDHVAVLEVNPRMCGQFADLYRKVDGTSGYEVALALARGEAPRVRRGAGPDAVASSLPLRVFMPVEVLAAPGPAEVAALEAAHPGALIWNECAPGDRLADFAFEDGASHRYAVLSAGGRDRADCDARLATLVEALGYRFRPLAPG